MPSKEEEEEVPTEEVQKEEIQEAPEEEVLADGSDSDTDDEGAIIDDAVRPESYRWVIENFEELQEKCRDKENGPKEWSPEFEIGEAKWRMLIFPNGNHGGSIPTTEHLSFYLEVADHAERTKENKNWRLECKFWLTVVNQDDHEKNARQNQEPKFRSGLIDWGFPKLIELSKLVDPEAGFIKDGKIILEAELIVKRIYVEKSYSSGYYYNTRATTGFVGLRNQGATCYLNSLMQGLYHIGNFRRAVHMIPTENDDVSKSIPLALQRLFYRLATSNDACSTKELTRSFGWSDYESFKQHDVQELNRVLMDNLETKMKKTPAEGSIERLFRGQLFNYMDCIDVDYKKERPEYFYDLSLVVKGCKTIYDSFDQYVDPEVMDGDNKWKTDDHGYQSAKRGIRFNNFPPVLNLQLKRWEMDYVRFQPYKVNDLYQFPPVLDLTKYMPADCKESGIYHLHAVLVHSGGVGGGHYYAYVRPTTAPTWYKFNDSSVSLATEKEAINDNWGGEEVRHWRNFGKTWSYTHQRTANAYMLIYTRETEAYEYMNDTADDVVQKHLKQISEEHLYMDFSVATLDDMKAHDQNRFDLLRRDDVKPVRVKKTQSIIDIKPKMAEQFGIPVERQRWWMVYKRDNKTIRPARSLTVEEQKEQIQYLRPYYREEKLLWLEDAEPVSHEEEEGGSRLEPRVVGEYDADDDRANEDAVVMFFKQFDPEANDGQGAVTFVGKHEFSRAIHTTDDIMAQAKVFLSEQQQDEEGEEGEEDVVVSVYEEITPSRVEVFKPGVSLTDAELQSGDICVFMKGDGEARREAAGEDPLALRVSSPKEWMRYMHYRLAVRFRPLSSPKDVASEFKLELTKKMKYSQVSEQVGAHLKVDGTKLRFTSHYPPTNQPGISPIRKGTSLIKMLDAGYYSKPTDLLYYEVLPVPLDQIGNIRKLRLKVQNKRGAFVLEKDLLVEKNSTLATAMDLLRGLPEFSKLYEEQAEHFHGTRRFRMLEVFGHKIYKVYDEHKTVLDQFISEHTRFHLEELSEEDIALMTPPSKDEADVAAENQDDDGADGEDGKKKEEEEGNSDDEEDRKDAQEDDENEETWQPAKVLTVVHFELSAHGTIYLHSAPFTATLRPNETVGDIKARIQEQLAISDEDFAEWKVAIVAYNGLKKYLDDDAVLAQQKFDEWTHLGFLHKDTTPKEKSSGRGGGGSYYSRRDHNSAIVLKN